MIIYGLLFVVLMIVRPQGLIGRSDGTRPGRLLKRRRDRSADGEREREPVG